MYHPPSKQRQIATRIIIYGFMTITVVGLVTVSLLYILGYRFDEKDRKVEQSGLVQYVTKPVGATVELDGKTLTSKTPSKSVLSPGGHEFVMWREGYETWRKSQTITAGTIMWLNYARLIPKERPVQSLEVLPKLASTLSSPNNKYIAAITDASVPSITMYDISSDDLKQSTISLSNDEYAEASTPGISHSFSFEEWSKNGRYLLMKHAFGDKIEWLVLDRQDGNMASNITKTVGIDMSSIRFADTNNLLLYALVNGTVRKINIANETISGPLVNNVSEFRLYDDNIIGYVGMPGESTGRRDVGVIKDGESKPTILHSSNTGIAVPLHVAVGRYFGKDYFIMSEGNKVVVWRGAFPENAADKATLQKMTTFSFKNEVTSLQLSPEDRFIIAQHESEFISYDLELKEMSPVAQLAGTTTASSLKWLDPYMVWSDRSAALTLREYDGANEHTINPVVSGFDVTLSENGKYLYSIGKSDTGFQLQRVRMILN